MTTIPSRLPFVTAALDCLLAQSVREFSLHLYIAEVCKRTNEIYRLPPELLSYAGVLRICRLDTDYGPATKLLGPLRSMQRQPEWKPRFVITVDDDVLLDRHAIEELLDATTRYLGAVIGFMGVADGSFLHAETLAANEISSANVSILGGYRGVIYPTDVLDQSIFADYQAVTGQGEPFLDDDHLFGWNLARRGIPRYVIATRHPGPDFALNLRLLGLPDSITFGPDGGVAVMNSHQRLIEYYQENGWTFPT